MYVCLSGGARRLLNVMQYLGGSHAFIKVKLAKTSEIYFMFAWIEEIMTSNIHVKEQGKCAFV